MGEKRQVSARVSADLYYKVHIALAIEQKSFTEWLVAALEAWLEHEHPEVVCTVHG